MSDIGQKLISEVRRVADANPNVVYDGPCAYVVDGKPGCIVGRAAWNLDLIDAGFEGSCSNDDGIAGFARVLGLPLDFDECEWLDAAQDAQDGQAPWGDVPGYADEALAPPF